MVSSNNVWQNSVPERSDRQKTTLNVNILEVVFSESKYSECSSSNYSKQTAKFWTGSETGYQAVGSTQSTMAKPLNGHRFLVVCRRDWC